MPGRFLNLVLKRTMLCLDKRTWPEGKVSGWTTDLLSVLNIVNLYHVVTYEIVEDRQTLYLQ